MLPIPKSLLIHSATIATAGAQSTWGTTTYSESQTLLHVRVEPSSKLITTKDNKQLQLSAILFFDCKNSSPHNQAFKVDDIVTFGNKNYKITIIDALYDKSKLHHYEIGLM